MLAFAFDVAQSLPVRVQGGDALAGERTPRRSPERHGPFPAGRLLDDHVIRLAPMEVAEWPNGQHTLAWLYASSGQ